MARKKKKRGRVQRCKRPPGSLGTQGKHRPRLHPGTLTTVLFPENDVVLPGPIMDTEHTDAKAVWEKLRSRGQVLEAPTDVDMTVFPTGDDVIAELRYSFDNTEWAAVVTRDTEGLSVPCFRLWYQRGEQFQKSGMFSDGTTLAAYIRKQAAENFKGAIPAIDTLERLKGRSAASVVPECFRVHARMSKCQTCPYAADCFDELDRTDLKWIVKHEPGPDEQMEEPEEVFVKRLQDKVDERWGPKVRVKSGEEK